MEAAPLDSPGDAQEMAAVADSLRRYLERRARAGVHFVARESAAERNGRMSSEDRNLLSGVESDLFAQPSPAYQALNLEELRAAIGDCQRCKLCAGRTHIVFGVGNPKAKLMFIGEGPGRDEDLQGEPFVGRAGQLLTDIITKGMGLKREDVYIANVVKCRPPENRNPEPDEVAACEPFLRKQIELIRPEIIVGLGKFAVQTLLQTKIPITKLRGQ
jgi:uracil-DNA glycosylase family 4